MKGREWYQASDIAQEYERKRFTGGGRLIDRREKKAVLDALAPVEGRDVLEIACGTGRFTVMLAEHEANVVGLDISGPMLQQGREKARRAGVADHLDFLRGDAARLPFPDDHFDAVVAMRFFHLADRPATFLEELCRVSRDQVVFDTFNRFSARSIYNWLLPMGSRLYSRGEVEGLLQRTGLEIVTENHDFVLPYGFYRQIPNGLAAPLRNVDLGVGHLPGGPRLATVSWWNTTVVDDATGASPARAARTAGRTD